MNGSLFASSGGGSSACRHYVFFLSLLYYPRDRNLIRSHPVPSNGELHFGENQFLDD